MIPYSYNMVDMGGIDLAEANRTVVEGLYNRLAMARNACGDLILYNWKFAEIEITPGICNTLDEGTSIVINGLIQVTEQDEVTVLGIAPPPVPVEPLSVTANGVYMAHSPVSGFNPVSVDVPIPRPRLIPITILENGEYSPPAGADGFNRVSVQVQGQDVYLTYGNTIFDTGIAVDRNTKVICEFIVTTISTASILGISWAADGFFLMMYQSHLRYHSGGQTFDDSVILGVGDRVRVICEYDKFTLNGVEHSLSPSGDNVQGTLKVFGNVSQSQGGALNIAPKSCEIYSSNVLVASLVPRISSGVGVLFDSVESTEIQNTGTGILYQI